MDYTAAFSWMSDNASDDEYGVFMSITSEDEAIEFAESCGATDSLED